MNLCDQVWSLRLARGRADDLVLEAGPIVLLGARVCSAFRIPFVPFRREGRLLVLPHPSGRCLLWNDPASRERARAEVSSLLSESAVLWEDR